ARYKLAGQGGGGQQRHENSGAAAWFRVGGNTYSAATAHFFDYADDAFFGRWRDTIAHLGTLFGQQIVQCLEFGWTVKNNRIAAVLAIVVVEHFPVTQMAGDADYGLAFGACLLQ